MIELFKKYFKKNINIKDLPSMGMFYPDDLKIKIKVATPDIINDYEKDIEGNIAIIVDKIKSVIRKCVTLNKDYDINIIRSIDLVFIFLEIVKYTKNKEIYLNTKLNEDDNIKISFNKNNFNYYNFSNKQLESYDKEKKAFIIDGFKFSLPSMGVEETIYKFLIYKNEEKYLSYSYDLMYFMGDNPKPSFDELETVIDIFNNELQDKDKEIIRDIVLSFKEYQKYKLKYKDQDVEITSRIDFKKIFE